MQPTDWALVTGVLPLQIHTSNIQHAEDPPHGRRRRPRWLLHQGFPRDLAPGPAHRVLDSLPPASAAHAAGPCHLDYSAAMWVLLIVNFDALLSYPFLSYYYYTNFDALRSFDFVVSLSDPLRLTCAVKILCCPIGCCVQLVANLVEYIVKAPIKFAKWLFDV